MTDESKYETVFLGGLPDCSREEIINLCGSTGRIASTRVRRGYAFIDYFNPADADFGIQHLHGIKFKGKKITAEFAHRRRRMKTSSTITATTSIHTHSQSFDNDDGSASGPAMVCYKCGTEGHRSSECAENFGTTSSRCFCCGSANHHIRYCPRRSISPDSGARPKDHSARTGSRDYDNGYHGAHTSLYRSRTREDSDRYYDSVDKPQVDSTPNTRFELDGRYYSRAKATTPRNDYDDTNPAPPISLYMTFSPYAEHVPSWQHESSYDNKYSPRSISPSYHSPPHEDVDRETAHSRGHTRSKDDSAQGRRSQTNSKRQNSASDADRYTGNYREERSTTAHRYYARSPSPRLQAPRRNAISGDYEYYYSRDFFEASVPQSAYHY
ncbi:uncharacterized protein C8R40DRAFT_760264 [Lentinula edodes]|uniref:uncharacterized protein n=1 Tax=Lentinula edodes TaxID=5353 RepID=UPI001E8D6777|nr:uncharacterized protein C8R40DRAFT_760264 [Lentinula edodes]KAH7878401.1 hypothetical protein C8R40DRAFT_760264 [Lentinula edodes]